MDRPFRHVFGGTLAGRDDEAGRRKLSWRHSAQLTRLVLETPWIERRR